jgi:signal transduction histidine kinase
VESMEVRNACVARDEQESIQAAEGLSAPGTTFLRGLLSGIRCGVMAIDRRGSLVLINRHGCEILGFEQSPPAGTPIELALADHPNLVRVLGEAFDLATLPNRAELDLGPKRREGTRIGFTVSHVQGDDGECAGAAIFFKDLTRIERSEEQKRLKDRLAALGAMAARLAHEVRNPLASIEVTCGLLRRRLAGEEPGRELVNRITDEVRRLNATVTSSLEFVKPVASNFHPGELLPLLERSILVAEGRRACTGASIRMTRSCEVPPFRMDPDQLSQVFENLLINATEAAGESGTVEVGIERVPAPASAGDQDAWGEFDELVVVRVADDGPGISDEVKERIFHPFFTTKSQGSGVGLSTVKKIVDSHGGLIDVDRSALGGARFTVRIPMIFEKTVNVEGQQQ